MSIKYDVIIIGAGPAGLALAQCYSKINNNILIIDKEDDVGGCHRVRRVYNSQLNEYLFTEHGPRIYSDTYKVFINLLNDMNINFYDFFVKYNFQIAQIGGETIWSTLNYKELFILAIEYFKLLFNDNYANNVTMESFLLSNNFTEKSIDLIDRICRLTDGAAINKYTVNEFLQLFNQQIFYKLYQPKSPNDIGLFYRWKDYLLKNNVKFLLNSKVTQLLTNKTDNKIDSIIVNNEKIYCDKLILATPPLNIVELLENSQNNLIKNSFGDFDKLKSWAYNTAYIDYISITFHWNKKLDLPKVYGFPKTSWGIAYIVLSDYMSFNETASKTVISAAITITDKLSNTINKTANQCDDKNEIISETFNQLKESFPNLPLPTISLLSPGIYYDKDLKKWTSIDTAYILNVQDFNLDFSSKTISNLFNVGTHNNKSIYKFTSLESAVTNSVKLSHMLDSRLIKLYPITSSLTTRDFIIIFIIIISIIFLYYKYK
jgi:hypothetical protein